MAKTLWLVVGLACVTSGLLLTGASRLPALRAVLALMTIALVVLAVLHLLLNAAGAMGHVSRVSAIPAFLMPSIEVGGMTRGEDEAVRTWNIVSQGNGDDQIDVPSHLAARSFGGTSVSVRLVLSATKAQGVRGFLSPRLTMNPAPTKAGIVTAITFSDTLTLTFRFKKRSTPQRAESEYTSLLISEQDLPPSGGRGVALVVLRTDDSQ